MEKAGNGDTLFCGEASLLILSFTYFFCTEHWQAVREIYEIVPTRKWKNEEKQMNKIVFIGKALINTFFFPCFLFENHVNLLYIIYLFTAGHNLNEDALTNSFRACMSISS